MKPRSVYKRCGIVHVCFKGGLYASETGETSVEQPGKCRVEEFDDTQKPPAWVTVSVLQGDVIERWVLTEIGKTKNSAAGAKSSKHGHGRTDPRTERRRKRKQADETPKRPAGWTLLNGPELLPREPIDRCTNILDIPETEVASLRTMNEARAGRGLDPFIVPEDIALIIDELAPTSAVAQILMSAWANYTDGGNKDGLKHPFEGFVHPDTEAKQKLLDLSLSIASMEN